MLDSPATGEAFAEIHALNRLFIDFLADRARHGGRCLGLGRAAVAALRAATPESLEALSAFPRALFEVRVPRGRAAGVADLQETIPEVSRYILQVTILHSARGLSRRSPYLARLLLGLGDHDVRELAAIDLAAIPALCAGTQTVACAFAQYSWLWEKLLIETRPEARRQLLLIALQPAVDTRVPASQPRLRNASA